MTGVPASASAASRSAAARSRLASPLVPPDWVATNSCPSLRCRAGQAIGSTVQTVAGSWFATSLTAAVAAGTISRSATHSVSAGSPSKGRAT